MQLVQVGGIAKVDQSVVEHCVTSTKKPEGQPEKNQNKDHSLTIIATRHGARVP